MVIGTKQSVIQLGLIQKIKVVNTYLKRVNKIKCLGLIIDDNLKWDDHIQYICSRVRRNIDLIEHIRHWGLCISILVDKLQRL